MAIFQHAWPNLGKIFSKKLCYLFTLIVFQLHAKYGKILGGVSKMKGDVIEPVAFAGSKSIKHN